MKPIPAIVEKHVDVDLLEQQIAVALAGEREAESSAKRHEQLAGAARETQRMRRLEVGRMLLKLRSAWPVSGPRAKGWSECLKRLKLDDSTAVRYMNEARTGAVHGESAAAPKDSAHERQVSQISALEPGPARADGTAPPAMAPRAVTEDEVMALLDQFDQATRSKIMRSLRSRQGRENEGDRDAYCTPAEITVLLPEVDLDPCSNPRSTVRARQTYSLEANQDGLALPWLGLVYCNPPYSAPLPWAQKLAAEWSSLAGAGFLVNADHSPKWWHVLKQALPIRLDFDERIEFAAPPGVEASKNDRPQTLLMDAAFWAKCDQPALLAMGTLWRQERPPISTAQLDPAALHIVR